MAVGYPVQTMVARSADHLPECGHGYEPKLDGFRCVAHWAEGQPRLQSRQQRSLTRWFPEVLAALGEQVRPGTVLDGELVVHHRGRVDFAALQRRLRGGVRSIDRLAADLPACLVLFDVLAEAGDDRRRLPYTERRELLARLLGRVREPLALMPATDSVDAAAAWLREYQGAGIEGVVAKPLAHTYRPGRRWWVKVRGRSTVEAIVGGVIGPLAAPTGLVLGLPDGRGRLRIAGRTTHLPPAARADLGAVLTAPTKPHPWPSVIPAGRVGLPGTDDLTYVQVEPRVVVELDVDSAFETGRWRHGARYRRVRLDLRASDVRRRGATALGREVL